MTLRLVTASTTPLVTLDEAKVQVHAESFTDDDTYLTGLVVVATEWIESWIGRSLRAQTWELRLDHFSCGRIKLPKPPVASITHIKYIDTAGTETTWAAENYRLLGIGTIESAVVPAYGVYWPLTRSEAEAVRVTFLTEASTSAAVKHAIKLIVGHFYENREDGSAEPPKAIHMGVMALLSTSQVWRA
jgi:uncharacterized phiE125 gp8 family phage protein